METKKKEKGIIVKKIEGELTFDSMDAIQAKMRMEPVLDKDEQPMIRSKRGLDLARSIFPADSDHEKYEITGTYQFVINIKEK